jgi:NAD(P)-dependent dehydrogenase (short-subunit alcohol dehydrogenase family)
MDLQLHGKRAIVTGASRGIGLAVARALAGEGASIAAVARGRDDLDAAVAGLKASGATAIALIADTRDDASVRGMVEAAVAGLGGVDILVNAAARPSGNAKVPSLAELTDDALREEFETKVLGYLRTSRAVAPHMIAQGWGRIINVSGLAARSAGSLVGSVRNVAVAAMTKNLADELGPHGVNVTVVHPGMTVTERTPGMLADRAQRTGVSIDEAAAQMGSGTSIGRLVEADEVAAVIAFLASPLSVAITGDAIAVGGGTRGPIFY